MAAQREVEKLCAAYFPEHDGYQCSRNDAEPNWVRVTVVRGDFTAEVEASGNPTHMRVSGVAGSQRVRDAEHQASHVVDCSRRVGIGLGLAVMTSFAAQALIRPPVFVVEVLFVLGGLLLVIMTLGLVLVGAGLGVRVGEYCVARSWRRVVQSVAEDPALAVDLRRWRALVRSLVHYRDAVASRVGSPFRGDTERS